MSTTTTTITAVTIAATADLIIALRAIKAGYRSASAWSEEDRIVVAARDLEAARGWLARHPELEFRGAVHRPKHSAALIWELQSRARRRRVLTAMRAMLTNPARWNNWARQGQVRPHLKRGSKRVA